MSGVSDSDPVEGGLSLLGLWIHDPLDAEGTVRHYPYGRDARTLGIEVEQAGQFYAGRTHQVFDYGEHQTDTMSVRLDVPHGPDWSNDVESLRAFAEARRTLCVRDNRGRVIFGTVGGYNEDDASYGTAVSFSVTRVDHTAAVA